MILPLLLLGGASSKRAHAQILDEAQNSLFEDLVLAVYVERRKLSDGIFAVQQNGRIYVPINTVSDVLGFVTDIDLSEQTVSGWAVSQDRTFEIDAKSNSLRFKNKNLGLPENAILFNNTYDDDIYVLLEVLNEIWPLTMSINLSTLILSVAPDDKLPFQQMLERQERKEVLLQRRESLAAQEKVDYPFYAFPYQLYGQPSVDITSSVGYEAVTNEPTASLNINGVQDLLYASADYSISSGYRNGEFIKPSNLRLRFTRQNIHEGALPFGLEEVSAGDVSLRNRDLVSSGIRGRGALFSTNKNNFTNEFSLVTIEGVGTPGYEVELYINNQLVEFGLVDETGVYEFEDVTITFGNNRIRTVLYGPQGQLEERLENYFYNSNMVKPGETEFSGGIVDGFRDFIPIEERNQSRIEGLAANVYGAYGVSERLTAFASASTIRDDDDGTSDEISRQYISVGGIASFQTTLAQTELYQELGGGQAFDVRTLSNFFGFNVNTRGSIYRDFESQEAGNGQQAKVYDAEVRVRRNFGTFFGSLGLEAGANFDKLESGTTRARYNTRQSLGIRGTRLSHTTRTNVIDGDHTSTSAGLSSTTRFDKWRLRNSLNYIIYPNLEATGVSTNLRFKNSRDFSSSIGLQRSFTTDETRASLQITKDFDKMVGSFETNWSSVNGFGFLARASTSFGPYGENGEYALSRESLRNATPVSAFIYGDRDYDGEYTEGDVPLPDTQIKLGRRATRERTNDNGYLLKLAGSSLNQRKNVSIEQGSVPDPYLVSSVDGYQINPRPGVRHHLEFPMIFTGAIDGSLRWANDNKPIAGLSLQLMNDDAEIVKESMTAADGYYSFEQIPPGRYTIRANPESGLNIPFEYIELVPDDLFKFGVDIAVVDLNRPMVADLEVGVEKDGSLKATNILSLAKGMKSKGRGIAVPVQKKANIQPAVQKIQQAPTRTIQPKVAQKAVITDPSQIKPEKIGMMSVLDKLDARLNRPEVPVAIQNVRIAEYADKVRLVLDLTAPVEYSLNYDPTSNSIFVEMPYASWEAQRSWVSDEDMVLNNYKVESYGNTGIRVILGLTQDVDIGASGLLKADDGKKDRLYLDINMN